MDGRPGPEALADPDNRVAYAAHTLITDEREVRAFLAGAPTVNAALWALCALHTLGADIAADYERLGSPRVEIPGLDDEVRATIRAEYVPRCEPTSDPRWRVESICAGDPGPYRGEASAWTSDRSPAEQARLDAVAEALAGAGLRPGPPIPCGDYHQSGGGVYYIVETTQGIVNVCALGRFVSGAEADRDPLQAAGFRFVDGELGSIMVDGLDVYEFGRRGPLTVWTLLFYWQD